MPTAFQNLQALVLDWAGTTVDHGSRAPAIVFQAIFEGRGVNITPAQAREPMGMAKRDHIAAIAAMPDIAAAWEARFGSTCSEEDIDAMYADFLPLQKETLKDHSILIPGIADAVTECKTRGLRIGSSTGYTPELMSVVSPLAAEQGYEPEFVLCAGDAPRGRPAPFLLFEAAKRLDVYPMWRVVKVDDTPVGIEAGRNAGCWTVGVTRTGNGVGLSEAEVSQLTNEARSEHIETAGSVLTAAGAHFLIESVADIGPLLDMIESKLTNGERP